MVALTAGRAHATLVVFPNGSWTAGAPAPGQTVSQVFPTISPTLTISLNNNGASATGATWAPGYPTINSTQTTGGFAGQNGLQLFANSSSSTTGYILTTVVFASPVTNVSFQLWDVDKAAGQFIDSISAIQALSDVGTTIAASSVTSAVSGYNTITGSGLGIVVNGTAGAGNNTNQGTIDISFSGPITQFSFRWSNTDAGLGAQAIGLGNINFTVVPEIDTMFGVLGLLAIVILHRVWTRKRALS